MIQSEKKLQELIVCINMWLQKQQYINVVSQISSYESHAMFRTTGL